MSRSGKKFNVWIAYSDLFTNLSTFLFISALGLFAALGAGSQGPIGPGEALACREPSEVGRAMMNESELLQYVGSDSRSPYSCAEYYRVSGFAFMSSGPDIGSYRREGRAITAEEIFTGICQPVWLTVPRQDFLDHNGRIVFQGVGVQTGDWRKQRECKRISRDEPRIDHQYHPSRKKWTSAAAIQECDRTKDRAFPSFCRAVAKCRGRAPQDRNSQCRQIEAVREWDAYASAACRRQAAQLQARTLYKLCELAPTNSDFPDHRFEDAVMNGKARRTEMRPHFWGSVDYNAPIQTASLQTGGLPEQGPLESEPGGSVVLELRFGR